jgi:hypothetical protein
MEKREDIMEEKILQTISKLFNDTLWIYENERIPSRIQGKYKKSYTDRDYSETIKPRGKTTFKAARNELNDWQLDRPGTSQ